VRVCDSEEPANERTAPKQKAFERLLIQVYYYIFEFKKSNVVNNYTNEKNETSRYFDSTYSK